MTQRPANVSSAPSPNQDGWTAQPDGSESGRDRHPGRFQPMARAMVKWLRAMVKLPHSGACGPHHEESCVFGGSGSGRRKSGLFRPGIGNSAPLVRVFEFRSALSRKRSSDFRKLRSTARKSPASHGQTAPSHGQFVGAMVKPAEQWSIRTRAERAIESGLDGALTQVIAKLPRGLVPELTGQPAGQRIADPPAWASTSALGPVHAPRSGYSSPRMAFN